MKLLERLTSLEKTFHDFRVVSGSGVTVEGNIRHGLAINKEGGTSGGGAVEPVSGVCCLPDGSCSSEISETDCALQIYDDGIGYLTAGYWIPDGECVEGVCIGACCFEDAPEDCYETNGAFCLDDCEGTCVADVGEFFLGETCEEACPDVELILVCDPITASKTKCGFTEFSDFSDPPKYYLVSTTLAEAELDNASGIGDCPTGTGEHISYTYSEVVSYDSFTCEVTADCSGSGSSSSDTDASIGPDTATVVSAETCEFEFAFCAWQSEEVPFCTVSPPWSVSCYEEDEYIEDTSTSTLLAHHSTYVDFGNTSSDSVELSDEYTTGLLISNTEAALPAYDEVYEEFETCYARRTLSEDEVDYGLTRSKYKFTFDVTAFDFTINWNENLYDIGGFIILGSTPRTANITAGATETTAFTLLEPDIDGEIRVEDWVVS